MHNPIYIQAAMFFWFVAGEFFLSLTSHVSTFTFQLYSDIFIKQCGDTFIA
jgi:hypothetical protein